MHDFKIDTIKELHFIALTYYYYIIVRHKSYDKYFLQLFINYSVFKLI